MWGFKPCILTDPSTFVKHIFTSLGYFAEYVKDSVSGITTLPVIVKTKPQQQQGFNKKNQRELYRKKSCKNLAVGRRNLERKEKGYFICCF